MEHVPPYETVAAGAMPCSNGSGNVHRHQEPIAPSSEPHRERRWPLVLLLSFLAVILVLAIADRFYEGTLLRKAEARSSSAIGVNGAGAVRSDE